MIQHMSLSTALTRMRPYDPSRAPLDDTLQMAVFFSGLAILVCTAVLLIYLIKDYSSDLMYRYLAGDPSWRTLYNLWPFLWTLVVVDAVALVAYVVLLIETGGLQRAVTPGYHYAAAAIAILGAPHMLFVAVVVAAALLVAAFYALMAVGAVIAFILWLASLGGTSNG